MTFLIKLTEDYYYHSYFFAIFVHVKSAYDSHKSNFRGLNIRPQIYKIVTKEHVEKDKELERT